MSTKDTKISITASLNEKLSTSEINKKIAVIERSRSLKKLRLNLDVKNNHLNKLKNFNSELNKTNQALQQQKKHTLGLEKSYNNQPVSSGGSLKDAFKTSIAENTISLFIQGMKDMTDTILNVESQMNKLKKVMSEDTNFDNLLANSIEVAEKFGKSIQDVNETKFELASLGFNEQDMQYLSASVALMQNISNLDSSQSINLLTSAMDSFNISAEDSISITDKISSIQNSYAISSDVLASSLQLAGGAANNYGVSLDKLLGDTVAISQATNSSGEEIGNALNAIYTNLSNLDNAENVLNEVGIGLQHASGESKNATSIIDELAGRWSSLTNAQQTNIAQQIAGEEHWLTLTSLMQNYNSSIQATERSIFSQGSAMNENANYMQTMDAQIQTMKTAWDNLALTLGNSLINDSISVLAVVLTETMNTLSFLINKFGALPTILGTASTAAFVFNKKFRDIITSAAQTTTSILGFSTATKTAATGLKGFALATNIAKTAIKGLLASTGVGLAFAVLGSALEGIISLFGKGKETQEDYFDSLKQNIQDTKNEISHLDQIISQLNKPDLSLDELNSNYQELSKVIPEIVSHFDTEGNAIYKNKTAIDELIKSKQSLYAIELKNNAFQLKDKLSDTLKEINKQKKEIQKISTDRDKKLIGIDAINLIKEQIKSGKDFSILEARTSTYGQIRDMMDGPKAAKKHFFSLLEKEKLDNIENLANNIKKAENTIYSNIDNINHNLSTKEAELEKNINSIVEYFQTSLNEPFLLTLSLNNNSDIDLKNLELIYKQLALAFVEGTTITQDNIDEVIKSYEELLSEIGNFLTNNNIDLADMLSTGDYSKLINEFPQSAELLTRTSTLLAGSIKQLHPVYDVLGNTLGTISDEAEAVAKGFEILDKKMNSQTNQIEYIARVKEGSDALAEHGDKTAEAISAISQLESAYNTLSRGEELSLETTVKLINQFPALLQYADQKTGALKLEAHMIENVANISRLAALKEREELLSSAENTRDMLEKKRNMFHQFFSQMPSSALAIFAHSIPSPFDASIKDTEDTIEKLKGEIAALKNPITFSGVSSKGKSGGDNGNKSPEPEDKPRIADTTQAKIDGINRAANDQNRANKILEESINKEQAYSKQIDLTSKLMAGKKKELQDLKAATATLTKEQNALINSNKHFKMASWLDSSGNATEQYYSDYNSQKTGSKQKEVEELFNLYQKLTSAIRENNNATLELYDSIKTTIDSTLSHIQNASNSIIARSNRKISLLGEINTQEEKDKVVKYSQEISDELRRESGRIFSEISKLKKIIADPKEDKLLKEAAKQSLKMYEDAANEVHLQLISQAETLGQKQAEAIVFGFDKSIEDLEYEISLLGNSDADIRKTEELELKIKKIRLDAKQKNNEEIIKLEKILSSSISTEERMRAQTMLEQLQSSNKQHDRALAEQLRKETDGREKWADRIVSNYKKMLEQQRDLEKSLLEEREKLEDEHHKRTMDRYKDELDGFKKIIDAQLQSMDRQNATDDYEREINKLTDEEAEIQRKINTLSFNDSFEDKAKRKELEKQLLQIQEEIQTKQRERERNGRKETLEDLLKDREDHISNLEKIEDDRHNEEKKNLNKQKEAHELHWKSKLSDEEFFYKMKSNLMSEDTKAVTGQLNTIKEEYNNFFSDLQNNATLLGDMFSTLFSNFTRDANELNLPPLSIDLSKDKNLTYTPFSPEEQETIARMQARSKQWGQSKDTDEKNRLKKDNLDDGEAMGAYRDDKTGIWYKNGIRLYHEGGEVDTTTGSTMKSWWEKTLNSNEVPAILKKGEVVLNNPLGFINELVSRTISGIPNILPKVSQSAAFSTGTTIENISLTVNGTFSDGYGFANEFVDGLSRKGIKLGRRN